MTQYGPIRGRRKTEQGFDFSAAMRRLCGDMVSRLPDLAHIDLDRVAMAVAQTRKRVAHGLYASLTPLRFEGGARSAVENGVKSVIQRVLDQDGQEMLYILTFYLPRFMEVDFGEKLVTILHELWHISPDFDGDLRRHAGRCYAHTHSQKEYDAKMAVFARRWLELEPPEYLHAFLRLDFQQLTKTFGGVHGVKIRKPKVVTVAADRER